MCVYAQRQEAANVKYIYIYEFGGDSMKMYFKHKTKLKVHHKFLNTTIVYNYVFIM
jgi:hypothetical protein